MTMAKVEIKLVKSVITEPQRTKDTIVSLGLRRTQQTVVHEVNGPLLGKLERVKHLVSIREI